MAASGRLGMDRLWFWMGVGFFVTLAAIILLPPLFGAGG